MKRVGKVSLWLGYFQQEKIFRDFMKLERVNINSERSLFKERFGISQYNSNFSEIDYMEGRSPDLSELLDGFHRDYEIIKNFGKIFPNKDNEWFNTVVLLYDFEYDGTYEVYNDGENELRYIGCVKYKKGK